MQTVLKSSNDPKINHIKNEACNIFISIKYALINLGTYDLYRFNKEKVHVQRKPKCCLQFTERARRNAPISSKKQLGQPVY